MIESGRQIYIKMWFLIVSNIEFITVHGHNEGLFLWEMLVFILKFHQHIPLKTTLNILA